MLTIDQSSFWMIIVNVALFGWTNLLSHPKTKSNIYLLFRWQDHRGLWFYFMLSSNLISTPSWLTSTLSCLQSRQGMPNPFYDLCSICIYKHAWSLIFVFQAAPSYCIKSICSVDMSWLQQKHVGLGNF